MLGKLKLRNSLILGYAVPIPLFALLAWLVYANTQKVGQSIERANAARDAIELTARMESQANAIERNVRGYLLAKQSSYLERFDNYYESLVDTTASAEGLIKGSPKYFFTEEEKNLFNEILENTEQLKEFQKQMITLGKNGRMPEAVNLFITDKSGVLIRKLKALTDKFNEKVKQDIQESQSRLNASMLWLNGVAAFGTVACSIAAVSFGLWLSARIRQAIDKAVSAIATSSTEIAATVEQQERTASQQATAVHQTTATMDELGASSAQSAEQVEATRRQIVQIAQQIRRLSDQISQIDSIANLVSELANQTNMLALNAAVEAVRAGEQGKGFAVVASEIRRFAEQSKTSAGKINTLVANIQSATNAAVGFAHDGTEQVESIVAAINTISLNVQQISLNIKQQATATHQVVTAMNALNQGAAETANGISQTKIGLQKLNEAALNLKGMM